MALALQVLRQVYEGLLMRKAVLTCILLCAATAIAIAEDTSDIVEMEDGTVLRGTIIDSDEEKVVLESGLGVLELSRDKIVEIRVDRVRVVIDDGSVIVGELRKETARSVVLDTSAGELTIDKRDIQSVEYNPGENRETGDGTAGQSSGSQLSSQFESAYLYEQQKKSVATGVALEVLGAGLIYAENYWLGIPLFLAQNALIVSAPFSSNFVPLFVGGTLLKTTDTILTVVTINRYNRELRSRLGIEQPTDEGYGLTGHSVHLGLGGGWLSQDCTDPDGERNATSGGLLDVQAGWMFPGSERFSWGLLVYAGFTNQDDSSWLLGGVSPRFVLGNRLDTFAGFIDIGFGSPFLFQFGVYLQSFSIAIQPFQPLSFFAVDCSMRQFAFHVGYDFHLGK
jgi:hypothetical protein